MGAVETKIFRNGDTMAVDLPAGLGFPEGTLVRIEQVDGEVRINAVGPVVPEPITEEKRKLNQLIAELRALGPITPVAKREPIEFPDRPGLYR